MPKTKIIATIGPASFSRKILRKIIINGADIIRFNFSHASHSSAIESLKNIKLLNKSMRRAVKKLADLKGNRIRIKGLKKDIPISHKKIITIASSFSNHKATLFFDYPGNFYKVKPGHKIFIEDGKIELETLSSSKSLIKARTIIGGILKNCKGVNFPESRLDFPR